MASKLVKRQFKGTSAPRLFFDRVIRRVGHTRGVSIGKLLPAEWYYVRMEIADRDANSVTIKFTKLLENKSHAPDTKTHKTGEQNT